ncbi:MAG: GAF domain-containing protein [Gammaproteobacteria bacterium]|nr:GAF domain-containing protein [Gammaproteobacteria bacterium]
MLHEDKLVERINKLTEIGISLSVEKNTPRLLESILIGAKELSHADAGTLYTIYNNKQSETMLKMEFLHNDSLAIHQSSSESNETAIPDIPLLNQDGSKNHQNVISYSVNSGETVNIDDVYHHQSFDFSGMRKIADELDYHPQSMLSIPMKDHTGMVIGALQLINAQQEGSREIIPFSRTVQKLVESLASQAAIALSNQQLINEQKNLLESIIQLVATAIDDKSPYTGEHCRRVPVLTMMLANAAHDTESGPLETFRMTEEDRYELEIAAWLHDCGKITTPEYVIDKATKLETIHDRVNDISTRYEVIKRDVEISLIKKYLTEASYDFSNLEQQVQLELNETITNLDEELAFIKKHNTGGEFMADEDMERIQQIADKKWRKQSALSPLLSENEIYNLTIAKGTLTPEEREAINHHIVATINMLEALPFPKHLSNVPEYAGGHHERMDGKGYPKGLTRDQMSVQARAMGIADVFEALTARDRPYKKGKTLTEALKILGFMCKDNHIDPDLFHIFIDKKLYQIYADEFMNPGQIDEVVHGNVPGYIGE